MATRPEIATLLGSIAEGLGKRRDALGSQVGAWLTAFEATPLADLRRAVEELRDEHPNRAPSVNQVRVVLGRGMPKRGTAESCGRCVGGLHEVAIRAKRSGTVDTVVRWAHCDCDLGSAMRSARAGDGPLPATVAELAQRAKAADPLAEVFVDPTPEQRRCTAEIEADKARRADSVRREARAVRWTQTALRVATAHGVTGANPHRGPARPQGAALAEEMLREVEGDDGVVW